MGEVDLIDLYKEADLDPRAFSFSEIGQTGLKENDGIIAEDFVPQLRTLRQRVRVFSEMTRDPVVGSVLFMIENTARRVVWSTRRQSDKRADRLAQEFLEENIQGLSHTWQDFLSEALSMIPFGFSIHEIVYKELPKGMIGWKKFAPRAQETVHRWILDEAGGIQGFEQFLGWNKGYRTIPIDKLLLFRPGTRKNNPEGVSALISAYRPWYIKKKIEVLEAIAIDRDLGGYPVLSVPIDVFGKSELSKEMRKHAEQMVTRIRRDEQMGAVLPPGWKLSLIASEGNHTLDTDRVIQRYDTRIAQTLLSDLVLMGHSGSSSHALAEVKKDYFDLALSAWMDSIAEIFNRYAVARLFKFNDSSFRGRTGLPRIIPGPVESIDPLRLANILFRLANIDLFNPTNEDEQMIRKLVGFPPTSEKDREEAREKRLEASRPQGREGRMDNSTRLESPNQDDPGNRV